MRRLRLFLKLFIISIGRYRRSKFELLLSRRGLLLGRLAGFNSLDSILGLMQRVVQFVTQPVKNIQRINLSFINQPDRLGMPMRDNSLGLLPCAVGDCILTDNLDRLLLRVGYDLLCTRLRITQYAIPLGYHALAFLDGARNADSHLIDQPETLLRIHDQRRRQGHSPPSVQGLFKLIHQL